MAFHLAVAGSIDELIDGLADNLRDPERRRDVFAPDLVVVPSAGVRTWVTHRLAERLGVSEQGSDGIVADIDFRFPAALVHRALGHQDLGQWSTDRLTWVVHEILEERTGEFGREPSVMGARAIADLFDRYTLFRPTMVAQWGQGRDDMMGRAKSDDQSWQPRLWRAIKERIGYSDAERILARIEEIRDGRHLITGDGGVPDQVHIFGLASLPPVYLGALGAMSVQVDVHLFVPVASPGRWHWMQEHVSPRLELPVLRGSNRVPEGSGHPLVTTWGRSSREANVLLLDAARENGGTVIAPTVPDAPRSESVLHRVQFSLRADRPLPEPPPSGSPAADDPRPIIDPADHSFRWHRAHGNGRQVEILRDALLHLFQMPGPGDAPLEPRDVLVLCTDVPTFAPLIRSTFAGDPAHGVPAIPVQVADRSLRDDSPLMDAAGALLDLLDSRFTATDVLTFASSSPVAIRFGFTAESIALISEWVTATNVRWGLDAENQRDEFVEFGEDPPDTLGQGVHSWRAGLDQLLEGIVFEGESFRLGPGSVAPHTRISGEDLDTLGGLADLVDTLSEARATLRGSSSVEEWCRRFGDVVRSCCQLSTTESWRWQQFEAVLGDFSDSAMMDGEPLTDAIDHADLSELMGLRLRSGPGRPRFGTGSVTVSSFTAQRGVPYEVVCLLGIDRDPGSGGIWSADDLVALNPCVGDRDQRSEYRAQLLDAVLSAGRTLMVLSNGREVRSNREIPPTVAISELLEAVDRTVRTESGEPASKALTFDHPRQAWAEAAFLEGEIVPGEIWSSDRAAFDAAMVRRARSADAPAQLPDISVGQRGDTTPNPTPSRTIPTIPIPMDRLTRGAASPTGHRVEHCLQISLPQRNEPSSDLIDLDLSALQEWSIGDPLLQQARRLGRPPTDGEIDEWTLHVRAEGSAPPGLLGENHLAKVSTRVRSIMTLFARELDDGEQRARTVAARVPVTDTHGVVHVVEGNVTDVFGNRILRASLSRLKAKDLLDAVIEVAMLTLHDPSATWESVVIGREGESGSEGVSRQSVRLRIPEGGTPIDCAEAVLRRVLQVLDRAAQRPVSFFAEVSRAVWLDGLEKVKPTLWDDSYNKWGERYEPATRLLFDLEWRELIELQTAEGEIPGVPAGKPAVEAWAEFVWGELERVAVFETEKVQPESVGTKPDSASEDGS